MPQTHPENRPPRAPIGLLLAPPYSRRVYQRPGMPLPDWYGIHPEHVALLIARYTRDGDVVLDLDAHPTVAAAARHLHRHPATPTTESGASAGSRTASNPALRAGLVVATLPRLNVDSRSIHALAESLDAWRAVLRPGGNLLILLTTGPGTGTIGHRSIVIAAARASGLIYHQHIPAVLVPLPPTEPRTEPSPASRPSLLDGRHVRAHRDLLAFTSTTPEAADA